MRKALKDAKISAYVITVEIVNNKKKQNGINIEEENTHSVILES